MRICPAWALCDVVLPRLEVAPAGSAGAGGGGEPRGAEFPGSEREVWAWAKENGLETPEDFRYAFTCVGHAEKAADVIAAGVCGKTWSTEE